MKKRTMATTAGIAILSFAFVGANHSIADIAGAGSGDSFVQGVVYKELTPPLFQNERERKAWRDAANAGELSL